MTFGAALVINDVVDFDEYRCYLRLNDLYGLTKALHLVLYLASIISLNLELI